jgi:hypothetical protein
MGGTPQKSKVNVDFDDDDDDDFFGGLSSNK